MEVVDFVVGGVVGRWFWKGTSHKRSCWLRTPLRTILSFLKMYIACLLNSAMQLSSHSCPIDSRDSLVMFGYTNDSVADEDKAGCKGRCP